MKVYNKKGLMLGAFWSVLGAVWLASELTQKKGDGFELFLDLEGPVLVVGFGLWWFFRAFSQKASKMDKIEEMDERNQLIKLKSRKKSLEFLMGFLALVLLLGGLYVKRSQDLIAAGAVLMAGVALIFMIILNLFTEFYYERKE